MLPRGALEQKAGFTTEEIVATESSNAKLASMPRLLLSCQSPQCFPPNARFQRSDGNFITASQLRSSGGETLRGPGNTHVRVMHAQRHKAQLRCFVKIHTAHSMLEVTHDHRVIGQGPQGTEITLGALDMRPLIVTGSGPQPVQSVDMFEKASEVVELTLEGDRPVLVWSRDCRRSKHAAIQHAFAVRGGLSSPYSAYEIKNGFIDDAPGSRPAGSLRSRSADSNLTPADHRRLAHARRGLFAQPG